VGNEDPSAPCVECAVIEGAARSIWYGDGPDLFQRHDGPTAPRAPSIALTTIGRREKRKTALTSSMRNILDTSSVAQSLDGKGRLVGSLLFPGKSD
jgi:hypothetical protein